MSIYIKKTIYNTCLFSVQYISIMQVPNIIEQINNTMQIKWLEIFTKKKKMTRDGTDGILKKGKKRRRWGAMRGNGDGEKLVTVMK